MGFLVIFYVWRRSFRLVNDIFQLYITVKFVFSIRMLCKLFKLIQYILRCAIFKLFAKFICNFQNFIAFFTIFGNFPFKTEYPVNFCSMSRARHDILKQPVSNPGLEIFCSFGINLTCSTPILNMIQPIENLSFTWFCLVQIR